MWNTIVCYSLKSWSPCLLGTVFYQLCASSPVKPSLPHLIHEFLRHLHLQCDVFLLENPDLHNQTHVVNGKCIKDSTEMSNASILMQINDLTHTKF